MNFTAAVACNDRWASFDPDNEKSAQRYNDAWSWPFCDMATVADNGRIRLGSRHPCMTCHARSCVHALVERRLLVVQQLCKLLGIEGTSCVIIMVLGCFLPPVVEKT